MKNLCFILLILIFIGCSKQVEPILELTKQQQDEIVSNHIITHDGRYKLTLTETEALNKGISKLNYKIHSNIIAETNKIIEQFIKEGKPFQLLEPISSKELQTKCNECTPLFESLFKYVVSNNRYSFTSRYTCIIIFGSAYSTSDVGYVSNDGYVSNNSYLLSTLYIRDLDRIASPFIGAINANFSVIMHKHDPHNTFLNSSNWIPTNWNIEILTIGGGSVSPHGLFYQNIPNTCI